MNAGGTNTVLLDDIHICGGCREEFVNIETFIRHKTQGCPVLLSRLQKSMLAMAQSGTIPQVSKISTTPTTSKPVNTSVSPSKVTPPAEQSAAEKKREEKRNELRNSSGEGGGNDVHGHAHSDGDDDDNETNILPSAGSPSLASPTAMIGTPGAMDPGTADDINIDTTGGVPTLATPAPRDPSPTPKEGDDSGKQDGVTVTNIPYRSRSPIRLTNLGPRGYIPRGEKKFKCQYEGCSYETQYNKDLERHTRIHTGERPFICEECNRSFNRKDKLRIHERSHYGEKPFQCQYCTYSTGDSSSLKKHIRIHTDERPFKCQICPYASRNSSQLIVHLRTHTGDAPFQCSICDAKFKINSDLKRHIRIHTGEKPYKCDWCTYRCSIKGNLKSHIRINHSTENQLKCDACDFKTSSRKMLREHRKIHSGAKLATCEECGYICANSSSLRVHKLMHSNEKPHKCAYCSYTSRQMSNVISHQKKKHTEEMQGAPPPPPVKKPKPSAKKVGKKAKCKPTFNCKVCGSSFVREDSLRAHSKQHVQLSETLENAAMAVLRMHLMSGSGNPEAQDPNQVQNQMPPQQQQQQQQPQQQQHQPPPQPPPQQQQQQQQTASANPSNQNTMNNRSITSTPSTMVSNQHMINRTPRSSHIQELHVNTVPPHPMGSQVSPQVSGLSNMDENQMINQAANSLLAFVQGSMNVDSGNMQRTHGASPVANENGQHEPRRHMIPQSSFVTSSTFSTISTAALGPSPGMSHQPHITSLGDDGRMASHIMASQIRQPMPIPGSISATSVVRTGASFPDPHLNPSATFQLSPTSHMTSHLGYAPGPSGGGFQPAGYFVPLTHREERDRMENYPHMRLHSKGKDKHSGADKN